MPQVYKYIILPLILGLIVSCGTQAVNTTTAGAKKKIDLEIDAALDSMSNVQFEYFYAKVSTDYEDSKEDFSFKTSLRIASDSVIGAVITFVRIPVASALITKDSLKISNKRDKCYVEEDLEYLASTFGIEFDYRNLEELLLGLPLAYDPDRKYFRVKDPVKYTFCSHRKNQIKLNERKVKKDVISYYTLTDDLRDLESFKIYSPEDTAVVNVAYKERQLVDGYNLPRKVEIRIHTARDEIKIDMEYKRVRINEEETIHFVIPDSYEKCK